MSPSRPRPWRLVRPALLSLLAVAFAASVYVYDRVAASLPQVAGTRALRGLSSPVRVERDAYGVPLVTAANRIDLARATGFLHAQERFFQMDLLRRRAGGELSELIGPATVKADRAVRLHRFRAVARAVVAAADADERAIGEAYADGVNQGLQALGARPFEYLLLRVAPAPWRPEDTVLCALAMFLTLQDERGAAESSIGVMHDVLPQALYAFLAPPGTEWDAPVVGPAFTQPAIPGPDVVDLRLTGAASAPIADAWHEPPPAWGSNNWAVAGRLTAHGGAILADDMHLAIRVPNTWYRMSLAWTDGGVARRATGVTLPGTPAIVVGSNGHVAWGFTNSQGDWTDLVVLDPAPGDPDSYLTPDGPRKLERFSERIVVKGAADEVLDGRATIWGPVVDHDHKGRARALRWVAHDVGGVNMHLMRLETAQTLEEALALANEVGAPAQNFTCVDSSGRIGWTILGRIPRRVGFDGRWPTSWADGMRRWDGWLKPDEYPRIVDPAGGRIWTANARVVDGAMLAALGDGGYRLGARARQIRDDLAAVDKAREADMLRIQLDDRALFLSRWRDLLVRVLTPEATGSDPRRAALRGFVDAWGGRAAVDSVGYRMVRAFRQTVAEDVLGALTAPCKAADPRFDLDDLPQSEGPLWALVVARPAHLLPSRYPSWDGLLLAAIDRVLLRFAKDGALASHTWGEQNTTRIQHPLSLALPWLGRWLDMPRRQLPGDSDMPRFQSPTGGASERLAVSPGREAQGIFHMPGGQSGHPLSPHYRDGHAAWADGRPLPFLPGPAVDVLTLVPAS